MIHFMRFFSVLLIFCTILLGCFACDIPEGFRKVAGGSKVEAVCNLGNWMTGADQHHFGTLHPNIFDVGADGYAHLLFEFSGQIVFRISHLSGEGRESQLLFCVQFDIVPAAADLGGNIGIGSVFTDPENEILKHGQVQGGKVGKGFALGHTVDISVTDGIGGIRGDSRLNGFPDAQVGKGGGDYDSFLQ